MLQAYFSIKKYVYDIAEVKNVGAIHLFPRMSSCHNTQSMMLN
jgi:hypothetical protein